MRVNTDALNWKLSDEQLLSIMSAVIYASHPDEDESIQAALCIINKIKKAGNDGRD